MLSVIMLSVVKLNIVMLNVIMLSVIMLSVFMLRVVMLNVIILNVVAPYWRLQLFLAKIQIEICPTLLLFVQPGNTKGGSITVPLTSCLTGLD